jgi:hypothetical protein
MSRAVVKAALLAFVFIPNGLEFTRRLLMLERNHLIGVQ